MSWRPAPALVSILLDANRVAPNRSHASDGILGDAAHAASVSDHNPDARGIVHACDVTHDPAGGFDSWRWAQVVADRIKAGLDHRVKYLVAFDGDKDVIYNASVAPWWRQNGARKSEHRSHLHVSILYTDNAENDQSRFFVDVTPVPIAEPVEEIDMGCITTVAFGGVENTIAIRPTDGHAVQIVTGRKPSDLFVAAHVADGERFLPECGLSVFSEGTDFVVRGVLADGAVGEVRYTPKGWVAANFR